MPSNIHPAFLPSYDKTKKEMIARTNAAIVISYYLELHQDVQYSEEDAIDVDEVLCDDLIVVELYNYWMVSSPT